MTQDEALAILKTGVNVFLTGEPGSGKTYTINRYVKWLRARGVEPAVTASTGIAATHVNGHTIHAWSGIGVRAQLSKSDLTRIKANARVASRVKAAHTLVIDEISMLSAHTLGLADTACRALRGSAEPFGGLQVVLVGDFFQLPPVVTREEEPGTMFDAQPLFAFGAPTWQALNPTVCYLSEQHRQDDPAFLDILSGIRSGNVSAEHRALLAGRRAQRAAEGVTQLFSHNADVDRVNNIKLMNLTGETHTFTMETSGPKELSERLMRGCLSPETLVLKVGAQVMFTKNDIPQHRFVNGTLGTVTGFSTTDGYPIVKTNAGHTLFTEPADWNIEEGGRPLARVTQVPLRLAWAITIHKSQGTSLDAVHMDLRDAFEHGQGYVAISRVRTLAGLSLVGFNERALEVHPEIALQDESFRQASAQAEQNLARTSPEELKREQEEFITACGGRKEAAGESDESADDGEENLPAPEAYAVIRETYPHAYKPWSDEDDAELKRRHEAGEKASAIAEAFGRKPGAIHSRLAKLGLIEQ